MSNDVLILGGGGQDGVILSKIFLNIGYRVTSVSRAKSSRLYSMNLVSRELLENNFSIKICDISDLIKFEQLLFQENPSLIVNCSGVSAGSAMKESIDVHMPQVFYPVETICNWIRKHNRKCRFVQLSSREVYGLPAVLPINEKTPRNPRNNYGIVKNLTDQLIIECRNEYGISVCSAILSNHVSFLSKNENLLKKIAVYCSNRKKISGSGEKLQVGSLRTKRSWLSAQDVCRCIFKMCLADQARDYVIGSSKPTSIEELLDISFGYSGLEWKQNVDFDAQLDHTGEDGSFECDSSLARSELDWQPEENMNLIIEDLIDDCVRYLN